MSYDEKIRKTIAEKLMSREKELTDELTACQIQYSVDENGDTHAWLDWSNKLYSREYYYERLMSIKEDLLRNYPSVDRSIIDDDWYKALCDASWSRIYQEYKKAKWHHSPEAYEMGLYED